MASYRIRIARSVARDLRHVDRPFVPRLVAAIESLADDPLPEGRHKKLRGSERSFRLRVGDYRILYEVDEAAREVHVYKVRHRREVYR